ncbi:hypothetical protein [Acinetobacter sp. SH20PTE14]|nr:hypothetical protein [Acinetobacter sp. SH20PTE14]
MIEADDLDKIVCNECGADYLAEHADKEEWEYCPKCGETFLF